MNIFKFLSHFTTGTEFVKVKASSVVKKTALRHIPSSPEKILDAPDITDDYCVCILSLTCINFVISKLE